MRLPHHREPATLRKKSNQGWTLSIMQGSFSDCAWVLAGVWPLADGEDVWIECRQGRFDGDIVKKAFDLGKIKKIQRTAVVRF